MKTTNHLSKPVARSTCPESLGRRTLALESMEAKVVLTAAMPVDAPKCGDEQVEVASYEVDATLPAPGGEEELSLSSYEVDVAAERPAEFYVASDQISTSIAAPAGEDEQQTALLLPAVQMVREAAATDGALDEYSLNFEEIKLDFVDDDAQVVPYKTVALNYETIKWSYAEVDEQDGTASEGKESDESGIDIESESQPITFTGLE